MMIGSMRQIPPTVVFCVKNINTYVDTVDGNKRHYLYRAGDYNLPMVFLKNEMHEKLNDKLQLRHIFQTLSEGTTSTSNDYLLIFNIRSIGMNVEVLESSEPEIVLVAGDKEETIEGTVGAGKTIAISFDKIQRMIELYVKPKDTTKSEWKIRIAISKWKFA